MGIPLLICDHANMALKQVTRSLPEGIEGIAAIRAGKGEMVFLDLTMPEMDGYQVPDAVRTAGHKSIIIVITGDIQPEARDRVMRLGALDFIKNRSTRTSLTTRCELLG